MLAPTGYYRSQLPVLLSPGQSLFLGPVQLLQTRLAEQPLHIRPSGFCTPLCLPLARRQWWLGAKAAVSHSGRDK